MAPNVESSPLLLAVERGPVAVVDALQDVIRGIAIWPGQERTPDIATILSEYERFLGIDGREIVRDAVVLLIEEIATGSADHTDLEISDVVHLARQLDVPGHRADRTCARLEHAWRLCAARGRRQAAVRILGLLAERGPTHPDEVWLSAFEELGPMSAVVVFRGLNRNGIAPALQWLDSVRDEVALGTVLAAVVPLVVKEYGIPRTKGAFAIVQPGLSPQIAGPIERRLDIEIARSHVDPQTRRAEETRSAPRQPVATVVPQREGSIDALKQVTREVDREPGITDFDQFDKLQTNAADLLVAWMAAAPETVEENDGRGLVRQLWGEQ